MPHRTGRPSALILSVIVLGLLAAPRALSFEERRPGSVRRETVQLRRPGPRADTLAPTEPTPLGAAARGFLARYAGTWEFSVDRGTGRAVLVQGSGIPLIPGAGNRLGPEALAGLPMPDGEVTVKTLEPLARALVEANRDLLAPETGRLVFDRDASGPRDGGRLWSLTFSWLVDEIPVEGAAVFVRINSGNVTQLGAPLVGGTPPTTRPTFGAEEAQARLLAWSGDAETVRIEGKPRLLLQPEDGPGGDLFYRLVWVVRYRMPGAIETWEGRLDARTGEVVAFRDVNAYGRVTGGVYPRTVVDLETRVPMPFARVLAPATQTATVAGSFPYVGGDASSGLDGQYFDTNCVDGCSSPSQPSVSLSLGLGRLDFGVGGTDQVGNGHSSRADRNAFYHLNQVRRIAKKWLPSLGWLDGTIAANVNIADTCNAFYDGTVNFFRSGGGCNNTGEISDVVYHEWGHGLDGNTQNGDGATGEATADTVSVHMTHDARIGPYFGTDGDPVRDLDKSRTSKGLLTRSNVSLKCPPGSGPLGREVHCEGEIYGQTTWDLAQALVSKHGSHTGWRTTERIFFTSLPDAQSYLPEGPLPVYDAYVNADDDDGNLVNGTPNGQQIYDAFNTHGIAGTPRSSSPGCARPAQPTVSVTPSCDRFALSWTPVTGATRYDVLRSEVLLDRAFFPVASVTAPGTAYEDTEVAPGQDYWYVVMAVNAVGCESTVESPVAARLTAQPILSATAVVADDTPRGNRSGFPDPGEEVDLVVTLGNFGEVDATSLTATLQSATPGVTLLDGSDPWPVLPPGGSAPNQGVLRFETNESQLACGDTVRFELVPSEGTGCAAESSWFDVRMGDLSPLRRDDFETDAGWILDAAASTAAAGHWVRGDPDPTDFQPGDDVTESPGALCWFTAPNGGGVGTDDVDDGVTVLVSPQLDLSGRSRVLLSYYRWFANRDLGEDSGDFFKAEVSSNDGAAWVDLENLGTNDTAPVWTRREVWLQDYIALTSQVRIRFQVSDGPATGNLIEAAVDELRLEEPVCDDTPACFTLPSFEGLDSAEPGASCGKAALAWLPAVSHCQNATITYDVHRSTAPGFLPDASTRIATGVSGTSYEDSQLTPGATYTYLVRAVDSRSGEEANTVRRSLTAPSSPDPDPPVFSGIASAEAGAECGEISLSWTAAAESCSRPVSYEVYRSTDAGFVPSPSTRVASTLSLAYGDAALAPGTTYTYVVRARDALGNEDVNLVRDTVQAAIKDKELLKEAFEASAAGWATTSPNTATSGRWERGDPEPTSFQPGDDFTAAPGVNAWVTGLVNGGGDGANDVDGGTTTLLSARYDLSTAVDPVVRYARWFTNDRGGSPGEDPFDVDVSNNDGGTWTLLEQVGAGTPLAWVVSESPLVGLIVPTANMRFRFTARDQGAGGSLVEAAVDEFSLLDRNQGCTGCPSPATVGTILVRRSGDDVVLDWTGDPVQATRYAVYKLTGAGLVEAVRIGTTTAKTFVHEDAAPAPESFFYRVSAINACGEEGPLE